MSNYQNFSIVGGSIWGNRGAEAMLVTTIAEIKKVSPDAEFYIYTIYPNHDKKLTKQEKINFLNGKPLAFGLIYFPLAFLYKFFEIFGLGFPLPNNLKHMRNSKCLLDMGGITFSDGRTLQLLYNVFSIWPAILLGVPVIKLSQAMGPFQNPLNRTLASYFLSKCEMVFARGELTQNHLEVITLPKNKYNQSADIAFLYQPNYSLSKENEEKLSNLINKIDQVRENGSKLISIIPSSLVFDKSESQYSEKLMDILRDKDQEDNYFIILPNASRAGSDKTMNNDLVVIEFLQNKALEDLSSEIISRVIWVDFDINTRSIRSLIGKTDALVTSRFHGMVAGLSLCVPTLVIGWSHKYKETMADFGADEYAINFSASRDETISLFRRFWNNQPHIKKLLNSHITDVKRSSMIQFNYLHKNIFTN